MNVYKNVKRVILNKIKVVLNKIFNVITKHNSFTHILIQNVLNWKIFHLVINYKIITG